MPPFRDRLQKLQLTQLSQIEVASPCSAPWEEMEGDEKVRFCSQCQLHVFNLSAMDVEEAGARIAEHADGLCVRFFRRADGTILTRDCPVGTERKRKSRRGVVQVAVAATFEALFAGARAVPLQGAVASPTARRMLMHSALNADDLDLLRQLVDSNQDAEAPNHEGTTLLMRAAEIGSVSATRLLLERGADPDAKDQHGRTALSIALAAKQWKVSTLLKKAGGSR